MRVSRGTATLVARSFARVRRVGTLWPIQLRAKLRRLFLTVWLLGLGIVVMGAGATAAPVAPLAVEKIVFSQHDHSSGSFALYEMNPDGSNQTRLLPLGHEVVEPSFSPDGTRIVFGRSRDGGRDIYIMQADGSNLTQVTTDPGFNNSPSFSPDGTQIVFWGHHGSDGIINADIYIIDVDGSNETRLTTALEPDYWAKFSPDGTRIVFISSRDNKAGIYVMQADGSSRTPLTTGQTYLGDASFSPDGTRIVFTKGGGADTRDIYVMQTDGSNELRLTTHIADDFEPQFSPDGTRIVFTSYRDGGSNIYVMQADGSNPTRLTANSGPVRNDRPEWVRVGVPHMSSRIFLPLVQR